jgi:ferredoxin
LTRTNASTAQFAWPNARSTPFFAEEDVPSDQQQYIKINADLSRNWPSITKTKPALPEAEQFKDVKEKAHLLKR